MSPTEEAPEELGGRCELAAEELWRSPMRRLPGVVPGEQAARQGELLPRESQDSSMLTFPLP